MTAFVIGVLVVTGNDSRGARFDAAPILLKVIDLAIRNSECFVLREKITADVVRGHYTSVLESLEPYLVKTIVIQGDNMDEVTQIRNTYRSHAFYTAGTYYFYRCCEESGNLLKQMANRLTFSPEKAVPTCIQAA